MNARRQMRALLVALAALASALALASTPAFAEKIYVPGASFGEPGSGPGQLDGPVGVAVNDASPLLEPVAGGDVYVVDKGNNRVERFSATGEYEGQFNGSGEYETTVSGKLVKETGVAAPTGAFSSPEAIAVDDDASSPSFGDVYVSYKGNDGSDPDQGGDKAIDKFSPSGEYLGQITEFICPKANQGLEEEGCPPGSQVPFNNQILAMTVDSSGNLWVYFQQWEEAKNLSQAQGINYDGEFSSTGALVKDVSLGGSGNTLLNGMAIDPAGNIYISRGAEQDHGGTVFKENVAKLYEEEWRAGFPTGTVTGVALNPTTGNLLVDDSGSISLYGPFGEPYTVLSQPPYVLLTPVETFPNEGLSGSEGLAVSASSTAYASENGADEVEIFDYAPVPKVITEAPSEVTETSLKLNGSVNPEGEEVKECYFEYGAEAGVYTDRTECEPPAGEGVGHIGKGTAAVPVSAVVSGLKPAEVRSFRLVAVSGAGVQGLDSGATIGRPRVTGEEASGVGSTSATINAEVAPAGVETCYRIEYGTSSAYGQGVAGECIAAGAEDVKVSRGVSGLQPGVAYHFRVVASSGLGTTMGQDSIVTTFPSGEGELPDGRVYELVSGGPSGGAGHHGDVYVPASDEMLALGLDSGTSTLSHGISSNRPAQAAAGGEAVTYVGDPPAKGGNGAESTGQGSQYVARRSAQGGWTQTPVSAPGFNNEYKEFSSEVSVGVLATSEQLAGDAPTGYTELYSRSMSEGPFEPLFTATPANRTPEDFGDLNGEDEYKTELDFAGGNAGTGTVPAFSRLLFEASAVLPSTPEAVDGGSGTNNLYESVGGRLYLVNVLPNGRAEPGATFGLQEGRTKVGIGEGRDTSNVISADGSRVYWSQAEWVPVAGAKPEERAKRLYLRENATQPQSPIEEGECAVPADACTVQVDQAEPGLGSGGGGQFVAASSDGSRVFFTDEKRLTKDSTAQPGEPDLYEYDVEGPEEERLSDLSVPAMTGSHADVLGVLGSSEDGSYVYFAATGVLTEGKNAEGKAPIEGQPNLYVRHGGATAFIVTLTEEDGDFNPGVDSEHMGDWVGDRAHRTAEVSPDGHGVVFMSRSPLTGYDNVLDGVPLTEVFVYDVETARIVCASCNPSGEPPVAPPLPEYAKKIRGIWGSFLPVSDSLDDYLPRVISEGGSRVFFDSVEPLVPRDSNGYLDVYEWERDGTGSCEQANGCIYLLSGGQNPENSYLLDASVSGNDVFFVSRAQLVSEDRGGEAEVLYDARVGGVKPPTGSGCSGTGCQGVPPAPPIFATPASVTFVGTGNFPPPSVEVGKTTKKKRTAETTKKKRTAKCPKGKTRGKHGKCVKTKKQSGKQSRAQRSSRELRGER